MELRTTCALVAFLAVAGPARAECTRAYLGEDLVRDLATMTVSLRDLDESAFREAGRRLEENIACIRTPVPPPVFAAAYRYIGAQHYFSGDEEGARRWFRTALELAPDFVWGVDELDEDHPMRRLFEEERARADAAPVPVEGKELNVPAGSTLFLDGRRFDEPAATPDRPHILQVIADSDRTVRQVFVIEGNAIPPRFLRDASPESPATAGAEDEAPAGGAAEEEEDPYAIQHVERVRPPAKTPLIVAGGAGMAAGLGLYAASFATRAQFEVARTTEELDRARGLTNALVVAAGATFALGAALEYSGVILAVDGSGWTLHVRF